HGHDGACAWPGSTRRNPSRSMAANAAQERRRTTWDIGGPPGRRRLSLTPEPGATPHFVMSSTEISSLGLRPTRRDSHVGVEPRADLRDDRGNRVHVLDARVEVHDARAERVTAVNDGVGDEQLSAALERIEDRGVERIEIGGDGRVVARAAQIDG